jgi:hypothetical protein
MRPRRARDGWDPEWVENKRFEEPNRQKRWITCRRLGSNYSAHVRLNLLPLCQQSVFPVGFLNLLLPCLLYCIGFSAPRISESQNYYAQDATKLKSQLIESQTRYYLIENEHPATVAKAMTHIDPSPCALLPRRTLPLRTLIIQQGWPVYFRLQ